MGRWAEGRRYTFLASWTGCCVTPPCSRVHRRDLSVTGRTRRLRRGGLPARATGSWDGRPAKEGRGDLVSLALDLGTKEGQP